MAAGAHHFGEGPTACPFVALDSDRDRRSDEPDHRHRCYAEPTPAPRAFAHQEAYCLSPNFPACPIFRDWAVRAAARPAAPGRGREAQQPADWAAPPPWAPDPVADGPEQLGAFDTESEPDPEPGPEVTEPENPEHLAASVQPPEVPVPPAAPIRPPEPAQPAPIERIPSLPRDTAGQPQVETYSPDAAAARDAAERDAARDAAVRDAAAATAAAAQRDATRRESADAATAAAAPPSFLASRTPLSDPSEPRQYVEPPRRAQAPVSAPRLRTSPTDERAAQREALLPSWERDRRPGAHPIVRGGRPRGSDESDLMSRLTTILAVLALLSLSLLLVVFVPGFLGGGSARPSVPAGAVSPSAAVIVTPTPGPPTPTPAPSMRTYTIKSGDSLFTIALSFGLTVDQILAANPEITDPNLILVGQVINIPPDDFGLPTPPPGATPRASP